MRKDSLRKNKLIFGLLFCLILLLFTFVAGRLVWLQIVDTERLAKIAQERMIFEDVKKNPRGKILDRDGEELAVSVMTDSLYVDPQEVVDILRERKQLHLVQEMRTTSAKLLAPILKISEEELLGLFNSEGRFLWVKRIIEPKEAELAKKVILDKKLLGLHFIQESKRHYTK